ncbi:MAG TPA: FxDxF family PEP-CTERM protein [Rhodocyclaceae bacterium]|nr:FxDxF family PEP-CTERM protein [Rhodocyclaceae bacterium]
MNCLKVSLKTLSVAVIAATASMSHAATTDWGPVAPGTTFSTSLSVPRLGAFEDTYSFSLLTSAIGDMKRSVTVTLDEFGSPESGFIGLSYGLYSAVTNTLLSSSYDALSKKYMFSGISAGDYYLKVAGDGWRNGSGVDMPKYNALVSITAAVPEPETYAMFLAGLGLVGTVMRRRSRDF